LIDFKELPFFNDQRFSFQNLPRSHSHSKGNEKEKEVYLKAQLIA